jgi:hypothetical protein
MKSSFADDVSWILVLQMSEEAQGLGCGSFVKGWRIRALRGMEFEPSIFNYPRFCF